MATVPSTQKFHTLSADANTKERGSALVDGLREVYTMADIVESVPQGTFKAVSTAAHRTGEVVRITGFNSTENLPIVSGFNNTVIENQLVGVIATASAGGVVDVIVSGSHEVIFSTDIGTSPVVGNTVFAGEFGNLYDSSSLSYGIESFPVGKVIDFTFVQTVSGYYDEYKGNVLFEMPSNNAFYKDGISFCSSERFNQLKNGTVNEGDIVMYASTGIDSGKVIQWASAYTDYRIAGVATSGLDNLSVSICTSGLVKLPTSVLVSQSNMNVGDIIYADSTDDYKLTTDSTSGTKIGIVHSWFINDSIFIMQVKL